MAFPYRKILCPIDFDENSLRALDKAVEIARPFGAAVILVCRARCVLEHGWNHLAASCPQITEGAFLRCRSTCE